MTTRDLVVVGEFGMLEFSEPAPPSRGRPLANKDALLGYLRSGCRFQFSYSPTPNRDPLGAHDDARARALRTDGVFAWPNYLTYYVETLDAELPEAFLSHVERNHWIVPHVSLDDLTLFGAQIRSWRKPAMDCERYLSEPIPTELASAFPTLNDLSAEALGVAADISRNKPPYFAFEYLQYVTVWSKVSFVDEFVRDVLKGGGDHRTWGFTDTLCYPEVTRATFGKPADEILRPLEPIRGQRWMQIPPNDTRRKSTSQGAPGVLVRQAPYWWYPPLGVSATSLRDRELVPVELTDVLVRRWLASRIADELDGRTYPSIADVCAALKWPEHHLSDDARAAIGGLVREWHELAPVSQLIPGFRGPDAWYARNGSP
jgi:hypothetical protein